MPQQQIYIQQRPKIETKKVSGWEKLRVFFGKALYDSNPYIVLADGDYIINTFKTGLHSNYKGNNVFNLSNFENFNTITINASGTVFLDGGNFDIWCSIFKENGTLLNEIQNNYNQGHYISNNADNVDWDLKIDITYFLNENNDHCVTINGYYLHSNDHHSERLNVSKVAICGESYSLPEKVYFDLRVFSSSNSVTVKQISIDFTE